MKDKNSQLPDYSADYFDDCDSVTEVMGKLMFDTGVNDSLPFSIASARLKKLQATREVEGYRKGVEDSSAVVLRRTEIPADAKNPTRDAVVVLGGEISNLIQALTDTQGANTCGICGEKLPWKDGDILGCPNHGDTQGGSDE